MRALKSVHDWMGQIFAHAVRVEVYLSPEP